MPPTIKRYEFNKSPIETADELQALGIGRLMVGDAENGVLLMGAAEMIRELVRQVSELAVDKLPPDLIKLVEEAAEAAKEKNRER